MPERPAQSVEVPLEPTAAVSWLERATEHVGVRAIYLSLAGHLVLAIMLTLLIFIGEAVRDAFDPRRSAETSHG